MNAEMQSILPFIPPSKSKHAHRWDGRKGSAFVEGSFRCKTCQAFVHAIPMLSGVHNRNHCPYCLWSRHLDLAQAGDRLSACKAGMQPIGLTRKPGRDKYGCGCRGELMLIHRCSECGMVSINRIAADDSVEGLVTVLYESTSLELPTLHQLEVSGIMLIAPSDKDLVLEQLFGKFQN